MALNRLIDAEIDARNPRTAGREIPRGALRPWPSSASALVSLGGLPPRRLPARPDRPLALADPGRRVRGLPVPEARDLARARLARARSTGSRPLGAWAAITNEVPWEAWALGGAVALWVAGFDLLYALFDLEVDRAQGLHSVPARFGVPATFVGARGCHVATVALLVARRPRAARWAPLLARRRCGRGAARVRALARLAARPSAARRGVLHHERRHLA